MPLSNTKDMRNVEFIPFRLTEAADIYSIRIDGNENTEFQEFLVNFKDTDNAWLNDDFNRILKSLQTIMNEGVKEYYFRPEGKMIDRVCAIPLYTKPRNSKANGTLRLYCIRVSDKLLILGGGGKKTTQTYEEDKSLSEKVSTLQNIDNELRKLEDNGIDLYQTINNLTIHIN